MRPLKIDSATTHKAEISDLDVAVCANEEVLRFQVAVYDILLVQVVEHEDKVRDVEACDIG